MMKRCGDVLQLLCVCAALLCRYSVNADEQQTRAYYQAPAFDAANLLDDYQMKRLAEALATTGLIALQNVAPVDETSNNRRLALTGLCDCTAHHDFTDLEGSDSILLTDGQTIRSTLATASVGFSPLPLKTHELTQLCGPKTVVAMEALRDQGAQASALFIKALDNLFLTQASRTHKPFTLLTNSYGVAYSSVSSIVQASSHLEHFHVYSKKHRTFSANHSDPSQLPALQVHTDAGLFLAFVPAQACSASVENTPDTSFLLKDPTDGRLKQVIFPPNSVAIMLGIGAEQWIRTPDRISLKATRHAVHMQPGQSRAWYGMMHLVPESAIVDETGEQPRTFGDMRQALVLKSQTKSTRVFGDDPMNHKSQDINIGCGFTVEGTEEDAGQSNRSQSPATALPRRRLQHVENAGACNNRTNFYCWMSCLDIPHADSAKTYISENYGLYCVDQKVMATTGQVSKAVEPCNENGITGLAMNTNCLGMWQPQDPNVPSQHVIVNESQASTNEPFCYGGTSMYMDGFQWLGSSCVIYLFPSIVLDSPGAMVLACFFTIAFGVALEWVICRRRGSVKNCAPGVKRLAVSAGYYAVQLTMGYTIMLVVMIYSIPLFISVVVGIVGGHVLFSASDALMSPSGCGKERVPESDCVESRQIYGSTITNGSNEPEIPEGSTPCCQNHL